MNQKVLNLLKEAIKDDEVEFVICVEDKKNGGIFTSQHCSPVLLHAIALELHKKADKQLEEMPAKDRFMNQLFEKLKEIDVNVVKGEDDDE